MKSRGPKEASLGTKLVQVKENKGMGKTKDLFGKIGDIKETFQARIDMIKNRIVKT